MRIKRINHVGIVSKNHSVCKDFFQNVLGLQNLGYEQVEDQKVSVDMFAVENSQIEVLAPTSDESPIAKFIAAKGGGIHHIALEVDNIEEWLVELQRKNIKLIDNIARNGAHHTKVAFIHPHATGGILVELVQSMN